MRELRVKNVKIIVTWLLTKFSNLPFFVRIAGIRIVVVIVFEAGVAI